MRWVFLSHDDHDHIGNLTAVLDACPRATLVTNWFTVERTVRAMELPLARMRWVNPGQSFDAGDRTLTALRPPIYDSPTTRGLFDSRTGVYWSVDSFASLLPAHVTETADVPYEMWRESLTFFAQMVSPWVTMTDPAKFAATVDAIARLDASVVVGGHMAALRGDRLRESYGLLRELPTAPVAPLPEQADLDALLLGRPRRRPSRWRLSRVTAAPIDARPIGTVAPVPACRGSSHACLDHP